jgi:hypothetical protein
MRFWHHEPESDGASGEGFIVASLSPIGRGWSPCIYSIPLALCDILTGLDLLYQGI